MKWFPWRFIIKRFALSHGFLDPIAILGHLRRFGQKSEIAEPLELLRAGLIFHARGLINTRAIQHNLDWIWPYWVERQFDPADDAFIPRAFSITHVNLTHRNWTALGNPGESNYVVVGPSGLIMPFWDSWSIDFWIVGEDQRDDLIPSRQRNLKQWLITGSEPAIRTECSNDSFSLGSEVRAEEKSCLASVSVSPGKSGWLVAALRPYNPEGISFINEIELNRAGWRVNKKFPVNFSEQADRYFVSDYHSGDVYYRLRRSPGSKEPRSVRCEIGMITAAALFRIEQGASRTIKVTIPSVETVPLFPAAETRHACKESWEDALSESPKLIVPDPHFQFLYKASLYTLVLLCPALAYPGPYTYKRFWFRDAAFMIHALMSAGLIKRAKNCLCRFPEYQTATGYFLSQEGEWDSNGQVLWILHRYCELTGDAPPPQWKMSIERGARWILEKRIRERSLRHSGLFPAGFSAEHLGTNDYYFWDNFWGVAGLRSASELLHKFGENEHARRLAVASEEFLAAVWRSIFAIQSDNGHTAIPASPYRRMDSGAVGSLSVSYPLRLCPARDPSVLATVSFLRNSCTFRGAFFQDMIHSGINAYLTLHLAQVLLRAEEPGFEELAMRVAGLASATGQWPEAIHPRTLGGCMGDGQHGWAAAEWALFTRNCFIREEGDSLILCSGLFQRWTQHDADLSFGPAPTSFGTIEISAVVRENRMTITWKADWRHLPRTILIRPPGFASTVSSPESSTATVTREGRGA